MPRANRPHLVDVLHLLRRHLEHAAGLLVAGRVAQRAVAAAESARLKLSDLRYTNGVASYLDLLDAQRSLFAARQALVQTRLAQLQSQVNLYKALGGGWTEGAGTAPRPY